MTPFTLNNGVRQRDVPSCILFKMVIEKVSRDTQTNATGIIFFEFAQLLAYANDIDIMGSTTEM